MENKEGHMTDISNNQSLFFTASIFSPIGVMQFHYSIQPLSLVVLEVLTPYKS